MTARAVGINHVALEVGDLDEALAFHGRLVAFELRGRVPGMAFLDLGDQFVALSALPGRGLSFRDPWGNRVEVVQYDEVQFTKAPAVARGMGFDAAKTDAAREELREKGLA